MSFFLQSNLPDLDPDPETVAGMTNHAHSRRALVVGLALILLTMALLLAWTPGSYAAPATQDTPQIGTDNPTDGPDSPTGDNCGGTIGPGLALRRTLEATPDGNAAFVCDCEVNKSHRGDFERGEVGQYEIKLLNRGTDVINGPLLVTDTLPVGMTFVGAKGEGWECRAQTDNKGVQTVLCQNPTYLLPDSQTTVLLDVQIENGVLDTNLTNRATIQVRGDENPDNDRFDDLTNIVFRSDLGDAPDSIDTHVGITNTAYPGIPGRFPTVWRPGPNAPLDTPSGPIHLQAQRIWLGNTVTLEKEADALPDQDGKPNILAGGADNANNDAGDDGWLNPTVSFITCEETTLRLRIRKEASFTTSAVYLNGWLDGNRDGDWADVERCNNQDNSQAQEWMVQNLLLDPSKFPSDLIEISVPTVKVLNHSQSKPAWVRFSLSEDPAVRPVTGGLADGRGPRYPNAFRMGETEDYLYDPLSGQVDIRLSKQILLSDGRQTTPVQSADALPGQAVVYQLQVRNLGLGMDPVVISDTLPSGLRAMGVEATAGAPTILDGGRTVLWKLTARPQSETFLRIKSRFTDQAKCEDRLTNQAFWTTTTGQGHSNLTTVSLLCRDLGDAPDSTNHITGTTMIAYSPDILGHFPTVSDLATDPYPGPVHRVSQPFHLGRSVSSEAEADQGPDADGRTNLRPAANQANLDRYDDGLDLADLKFSHCESGMIPVDLFIAPDALPLLNRLDGVGYLNVWLDGNRDGDWDDAVECPTALGSEHLVIDYKVDVNGLGPGLHRLTIPTSGPVPWPENQVQRPAWLRLTLSERSSVKNLGSRGDGRGAREPFQLGETEDYLVPPLRQPLQPDLTVQKRGAVQPYTNPAGQRQGWLVRWVVEYANLGPGEAHNVKLTDLLGAGQIVQNLHVYPPVTSTVTEESRVTVDLGTLPKGAQGIVVVESLVSEQTPVGQTITNSVTIRADEDANPENNRAEAQVAIPFLPPVITSPIPGTTCSGELTIIGRAAAGAKVEIWVDGEVVGSTTGDTQGSWRYAASLAAGEHEILAAVMPEGGSALFSAPVVVIVDPSLTWDPISLRFQTPSGQMFQPKGQNGRLDATGWRLFLRPGQEYSIFVRICCQDPDREVSLELGDGSVLPLTDVDQDGVYSARFTPSTASMTQGVFRICVTCQKVKVCSDGQVTIDPEGVVFDLLSHQLLSAAQVACLQAQAGDGQSTPFDLWPAADYGQVNPQFTAADGYFSFFTPAGVYRLGATRDGYQPYISPDLAVVAEPVEFNLPLTPRIDQKPDYTILIGPDGFTPAYLTVEPGSVVAFVNGDVQVRSSTSITPMVQYPGTVAKDAWDSGLLQPGQLYLRRLTEEGSHIYGDRTAPINQAVIEVQTPVWRLYLPVLTRN